VLNCLFLLYALYPDILVNGSHYISRNIKLSIKFDVVDIKIIILMAVIPSTHTKRPSLELKLPAVLPLYKKPYNTAVVNMIAQMPNKDAPNVL